MTNDLCFMSASELHDAYGVGELSPVEATKAILAQIGRRNESVNAFTYLDEEAALASAARSESRWVKGEPLGPLDGIPATVKDNCITEGWPSFLGSLTTDSEPAGEFDAPCVARIREAGAVLIGKTTTPEFAWKGATDSPRNGVTRNPWDSSRAAGGSSGGAAAALAAGMCTIAIGNDGGGSIRTPASFCGVVGLKPTFGRVPIGACEPFSSSTTAVHGPITRSVADSAVMMNAMCSIGPQDGLNASLRDDFLHDSDSGVQGFRIAYSPTLGYAREVDPDIATAVRAAVELLSSQGAIIEERNPDIDWPIDVYNTIAWVSQAHALAPVVARHADVMDPDLVDIVREGESIDKGRYFEALGARVRIAGSLGRFLSDFDLLATPSIPLEPCRAGDHMPEDFEDPRRMNDWLPYSSIFNLTGQPAITVPCGLTTNGLPVGLQIIGRLRAEGPVLKAARAYETARDRSEPWTYPGQPGRR